MLIEDMDGKFPTQRHEAGHLRPRAIGDEERVVSNVERRSGAELSAPQSNGAHVLEVLVQLVRYHAQWIGKFTVADFVFEIRDDDVTEVAAHETACLAPSRRNRAG